MEDFKARIKLSKLSTLIASRKKDRVQFMDERWTQHFSLVKMMHTDILELDASIFQEACILLKDKTREIVQLSRAIGEIDVCSSLGMFAHENGYTKPIMTEE